MGLRVIFATPLHAAPSMSKPSCLGLTFLLGSLSSDQPPVCSPCGHCPGARAFQGSFAGRLFWPWGLGGPDDSLTYLFTLYPLSATVTLTVAVADSIPDVLADLGSLEVPHDSDVSGLTLYLVVAVAAVSCVFLAFVIVLLALRLRHWHLSRLLQTSGSGLARVPASHFVGVDGVRAFLQTYSHEVSLTADSRGSHVIFPQPNYADTLISQESCGKSEPLLIQEDFCKEQDFAVQVRLFVFIVLI